MTGFAKTSGISVMVAGRDILVRNKPVADAFIGFVDPGEAVPVGDAAGGTVLVMTDIGNSPSSFFLFDRNGDWGTGVALPDFGHVRKAMDAIRAVKDGDRVVCWCHAGICRSAALAVMLLFLRGADDAEIERVVEGRFGGLPNVLFCHLVDTEYGTGGRLAALAERIWKKRSGKA